MLHSNKLFARAQTVIPGGVNSPVRAFKSVGGTPLFFKRGKGPYLFDVDGNKYIDYVASWGPLILGHCHPLVTEKLHVAITQGLGFGAPTEIEVEMAELITHIMPSIQQIRMVNSGTEATQSAIRLARGFTGKNKIIKFQGCYHGHSDGLLVKAGSGLLTYGIPDSPGVPDAFAQQTLTAPFNDLKAVQTLLTEYGDDIAAIIVEPIAGNMNCILPQPDFLPGLRSLCDQYKTILIFDEVITGFRVALGGAQALFNVKPDLTCLGKIIGGGLPVGAFGGRKDIMEYLAPSGPVYQAGTLSGNPIALTAGLTTLQLLLEPEIYPALNKATQYLINGMMSLTKQYSIPLQAQHIGSIFGLYFTEQSVPTCYEDVIKCNIPSFKKFFHAMRLEGIYLGPSAFEVGFVSTTHNESVLNATLEAMERIFKSGLMSEKTEVNMVSYAE